MIDIFIPAPRVNKLQKTKGGFKKLPNGKRAPAVERPAWLTSNQRLARPEATNRVSMWRSSATVEAKAADLPKLGITRVFCLARIHNPRNVDYDAQNWYPTVKPIIDGLIDYGILPDDNNNYLIGPLCVKGDRAHDGFGGVTLEFYDLTDNDDVNELTHALFLSAS